MFDMNAARNCLAGLLVVVTTSPSLAWAQSRYADQGAREVVRRPVYETRYVPRQQIAYDQVPETRWRTESSTRWEPVTRTERVVVDEGRWERVWVPKLGDWDRVWVPNLVEREETQTTYERRTIERQVPYQALRTVPVTTTRYEPVVTRRIVEEEIVRGDAAVARSASSLGRTASSQGYRSQIASRPAAIASRSSSSIPASRLGSYRPVPSRAGAAFDQLDSRVASRTLPDYSSRSATGRRPYVPTAATAWQASDTLRR
jgi:hypothetical protein